MANTELSPIQSHQVDAMMALVREAGWNQVPADWNVMSMIGHAVQLRLDTGEVAASALALPHSERFGWISMVLVAIANRRQGHATALLKHCIDFLQTRDIVPVLDATPDGAKVYEKLGFTGGDAITRWQGEGLAGSPPDEKDFDAVNIREASAAGRNHVLSIDKAAFGADRTVMLNDFMDRSGSRVILTADNSGFAIVRQGSRAAQIGPLTAKNEHDAGALLLAALRLTSGPVFLDAFDKRHTLSETLIATRFEKQRSFVRMSLGAMPDFDGDGRAMVIAGPEYG